MAKFRIVQRVPQWVTWTYEVEARNAREAEDMFLQGDHDCPIGPPGMGDYVARMYPEETITLISGDEIYDDDEK